MAVDKKAPVIIVGAGTFGLSAGWRLAQAGYSDLTILDRHEAPSVASACHDLNKVFRTEYADNDMTKLAIEARDVWRKEPLLKGCLVQNGYVFSVTGESETSVKDWQQAVANSKAAGSVMEDLNSPADFKAKAPFLTGEMKTWKGVYVPDAGWMNALKSLTALTDECRRLGVKFKSGPDGTVVSPIYDDAVKKSKVIGVRTLGAASYASTVILACGAWVPSIIDVKGQIVAKAWTLCHVQLTPEEEKAWKDAPVINNRELGYMFEPQNGRLKVAPQLPGFTNYLYPGHSAPRSQAEHPSDTIPDVAHSKIRRFLSECVPEIAKRPFVIERLCWDGETMDANFLITKHPEHEGLIIAAGGSAHAAKFLPTIGSKILDVLEDKLDPALAQLWRWRPEAKRLPRTDLPGGDLDLSEAPGWRHDAKL